MSNSAKPTALRLLEGNRGHRTIPEDNPEPEPIDVFPEPPDDFDLMAREKWNNLGPLLFDMGVLTAVDIDALEWYCRLYSNLKQKMNNQDLQQLRMFMNELGITPASRGKLHVSKPKKDDSKFGGYLK